MAFVNTITATVLGAKRYSIDKQNIAVLFVSSPNDGLSPDVVGLEVMKATCPYDLIDSLRGYQFPFDAEMKVNLKAGTGGRMSMICLSLSPLPASRLPNSSATATADTTKK